MNLGGTSQAFVLEALDATSTTLASRSDVTVLNRIAIAPAAFSCPPRANSPAVFIVITGLTYGTKAYSRFGATPSRSALSLSLPGPDPENGTP